MRGLDHHNRMLLVRASVSGKTNGIVLVLTRPGAVPHVATELRALGARVEAHFDEVGYLRVRLPLARFASVRALPDVAEARIDDGYLSYHYDQGTDERAIKLVEQAYQRTSAKFDTTAPAPPPVPAAARRGAGLANPYVPMSDMGAPQFTRAHPTYDGRGVTIGVLELGVLDLTHPALRWARTLAGDSVPKVVGIITPSAFNPDPEPGSLAPLMTLDSTPNMTRVRRSGPIDVRDNDFSIDGQLYHAPRSGRYAFGFYRGYKERAGEPYAVLWDSAGHVWVDTNRNRDFRDEAPLGDFNQAHETGYLRRDSTAAKPGRSIPFAVVFDSGGTALHLYEGMQDHQTMVASIAAGHGILGGADASAPGAQLVIVDAGNSLSDAIEGFIRAARDRRIDVITTSQEGETFPSTGESILALVLARLVQVYHKPIFAHAGNTGPLISRPLEPGNDPSVISVGGYASRETYRAHYGWHAGAPDWLVYYSARGPALDGAMKPDLVAPLLSIVAAPCSAEPEPARFLVYTMPPCYALAGGTSAAAPDAAGAAALLISAAKQAHVSYDAARIGWALRAGARPLAGYGVNEQGAGLIDIHHSWDLLRGGVQVPEIRTDAPVRTRINPYLRRPGHGRGLYEREGWAPGDTGTRTIALTRTSGPPGGAAYGLRWRGNDGTFSVEARRVSLERDRPTEVPVRIAPRADGVHSAALQVFDLKSGVPVHEVLATVVAANQLTGAAGYSVRLRGSAEWPRPVPFFVNVPAGTAALRVEMHVNHGRLGLRAEDPATLDMLAHNFYVKGYRYPYSLYSYVPPGHSGVELFPNPIAGVWELTVVPVGVPTWGGDSAQYHVPADVELVVSAVGSRASGVLDPASGATETRVQLEFTNTKAPLAGAVTVAELGTRRTVASALDSSKAGPTHDIQVDSGTTSLRVAVEPASDSPAHLDLYLFDCTTGPCYLWDVDFIHDARAELLVRAPRPGLWKAVVDPAYLPTGTADFRYAEVMTNPKYGAVTVDTAPTPRATRAHWTEQAVAHPRPVLGVGEPVLVADMVDQSSEVAERANPLAVWGGTAYRPVVVTTVTLPLPAKR